MEDKPNKWVESLMKSVAQLEILEKEHAKRLDILEKRMDAQYDETLKIRQRLDKLEKH
jgi:hypothetical protein